MGKHDTTSARQRSILARSNRRRQRKLELNIRRQQQSTDNIIPTVSFSRVVREILADMGEYSVRSKAMKALQCAAEEHMTDVFMEACRLAAYQKRDTVQISDLKYVLSMPQEDDSPTSSSSSDDAEEESEPPPLVPVQ